MVEVVPATRHTTGLAEGSHCISDLYISRSFVLSNTAPEGFTRLDLSSFAGCPFSNPEGLP